MEESIKTSSDFSLFFKKSMQIQEIDVCNYSPLALAYIGDGVYELIVRTKVVSQGSMQVNKMHKKSSSLVKAEAQASLYKVLEEELTSEEQAVYKRGRNAKSVTVAKHAAMIDYRMATGFEALVGYLYLTEQFERLITLMSHGFEKIGELT